MEIRGLRFTYKGGEHSGHHGHAGRPGSVGGSMPRSATGFIGIATGAIIDKLSEEPDAVLGDEVNYIFGEVTIQTKIRETDREVFLNSIASKNTGDLTVGVSGTGRGMQVINALKDYSDRTGKKLIVPDATHFAVPFWDRIEWLNRDYGVVIDLEGIPYRPPNTYSYIP